MAGERQLLEEAGEGDQESAGVREDFFERAADFSRVALDVCVEDGLADDGEGHAHHLGGDVQGLAVAPAVGGPGGEGHHVGRVRRDALVVEDRLDEAPLAAVQLGFAGEQPFAQEALELLDAAALHEALVVGDQHLADELGVADEHEAVAQHLEGHDVAVLARQVEQRAGGSAQKVDGVEAERELRTGQRARGGGHRSVGAHGEACWTQGLDFLSSLPRQALNAVHRGKDIVHPLLPVPRRHESPR